MRGKKWLTIITFFCTVIALIVAFVIGKGSDCIFYDIAMAVFGSALLGFIMSLTEYFVERRNAMECFWQESRNALIKLRKVKYISIDAPVDLVHACFYEEWSNDFSRDFNESEKTDAKNALISWYEDHNNVVPYGEGIDIDAELDKMYKAEMDSYRKGYMKCIDSYIEASAIDLGALGNAYGNLDFIFCNKRIRNKAFSDIYDKIRTFRNLLLSESYHFKLLKSGNGNFPVCARKADDICKKIFDVQCQTGDRFNTMSVYQMAFDDIDIALETFRLQIYRNAKPDYPEKVSVLSKIQTIDFENNSREEMS